MESNPWYPLNGRLHLAKQLTSSLVFLHSSRFVHKNLRPEAAIVFENEGEMRQSVLGTLCLVGFRPAKGVTYQTGDDNWQCGLCA